jgi:hypothetical protein
VSAALRRGLCGAVAVGALLTVAPAALATTTQTAHSGNVTATYTFAGKYPMYTHQTLTIEQSGQVFYKQPVTDSQCGKYCAPFSTESKHPSVQVLDIEHTGQPDVILSLWTGGANCCVVEQVFSYDPGTMTYTKTRRDFGPDGAGIEDLNHNGRFEFVGDNYLFKYEFTDGAASGLPLEILTFSGGKFTNVTTKYPKLIAKDAARWLKFFKKNLDDGVGLIAAWAADEDELGDTSLVSSYLQKELKAGDLRSALGNNLGGEKFIKSLTKFLRQQGYLK